MALIAIFVIGISTSLSAMDIYVRTQTGKNTTYSVEPTDTILALKTMIYTSDPSCFINLQQLLFAGKTLDNTRTLADYNIQKESTIHLILKSGLVLPANADTTVVPVTLSWYNWISTVGSAGTYQISYKLYIADSEAGLADVEPQNYGPNPITVAGTALLGLMFLIGRRKRLHRIFFIIIMGSMITFGLSCGWDNDSDSKEIPVEESSPPACYVGSWNSADDKISCALIDPVPGKTYYWKVETLIDGVVTSTSEVRSFTIAL
jgi:hypothetical protein